MRTLNAALVLASIAVAPIACAADLGDPQRGLVYAKKACAECHSVEAGGEASPNIMAPSFGAVADMPGMNGRALAVWLQSSDHANHGSANLMIASGDLDDVVAYIVSLHARK